MDHAKPIKEIISQEYPDNQFIPHDTGVVSFSDFKKALGLAANKYSDKQIDDMRISCDKFADIFFDDWLREKNSA